MYKEDRILYHHAIDYISKTDLAGDGVYRLAAFTSRR